MKDEKSSGLLLSYSGNIKGIRVLNNSVIPTSWDINIDFFTQKKDDENDITQTVEATVSFQVLTYWINELIQDIIVFDPTDEFALSWVPQTYNAILTTPGVPTDDLFARVVQKKIETLVGDRLGIVKTSFLSEDGGGMKYSYFDFNKDSNSLPDISYVGTQAESTKVPWWERKTSECYDLPEETELPENIIQLYTQQEDVLTEYEEMMRDRYEGIYKNPVDHFAEQLVARLKKTAEEEMGPEKIIEFPNPFPNNGKPE